MKKQSLNIITLFLLTILGFTSLFSQQKGGEILNNKTDKQGATYALVIGISDYQHEGIPDLEYAHKDAEAFAGFLQSKAGGSLDLDHLKVLINEEATSGNVGSALRWLVEEVKEEDKVIIYFSGHGDVESNTLGQPGFLLCWDAPPHVYIVGGTLGLYYFQTYISTLSLQNKARVVVIADACRAGKLSGSGVNGSQITSANLLTRYANESKILSCQPTEYSIEGEQWGGGRGAFSYHLVNGLYGMADRDKDKQVTMSELRIYLEEKVTPEVEPYSQLPELDGDGREILANVDDEILTQLLESKRGEVQMYNAIALKGIQDRILDSVDITIKQLYDSFELALEEKRFLAPEKRCAEFYYAELMSEPSLEELHSAMTRNYAAALQDDAQQALNTLLTTGLTKRITQLKKTKDLYKDYPSNLERAAELLGENHYMYSALMARKVYFQGRLVSGDNEKRKQFYQEALQLQPDLPYVYQSMMWTFEKEEEDSTLYYAKKAMELVPSWVHPYVNLYYYYKLDLNDLKTARKWLIKAEQVDSNSALVLYTIGQYYNEFEVWDSAAIYYKKAIENISSDICFPCVYNQLGHVYLEMDSLDIAEEHFQYALYDPRSELNPALLYVNLSLVHLRRDSVERCLKYLDVAESIDSTIEQKYYYLRGRAYNILGEFDRAEKNYLFAMSLDSTSYGSNFEFGDFYYNQNKYAQALPWYKKAITNFPNNGQLFNRLGYCLYALSRYDEAIIYYEKALQIDPESIGSLGTLGAIYGEMGKPDLATPLLKKAVELGINDANAYFNYGGQLANMGMREEGLKYIMMGLAIDSTNTLGNTNCGIINYVMGNYSVSEKHIKRAIHYDSSYLFAYQSLSNLYLRQNRTDDAFHILDLMKKRGADPNYVVETKINILSKLKRHEEAEKILKDHLHKYPEANWAYARLGIIYTALNNYELAESQFNIALEYNPYDKLARWNLAKLYTKSGKFIKAIETCNHFIQQTPNAIEGYRQAGEILYSLARYEEAKQILEAGIKIDSSDWGSYIFLGQIYQALGQWDASIPFLKKAAELKPWPRSHLLLALAYVHLGYDEDVIEEEITISTSVEYNNFKIWLNYIHWLIYKDDLESAWKNLEQALELANGDMLMLAILENQHQFKPLVNDSRWPELKKKYYGE